MVLAHHDELLRRWGWKMILQVHDELMLEGPAVRPHTAHTAHDTHGRAEGKNTFFAQESAEEALARLIEVMQNPMPEGEELLVALAVDGKAGSTWYEAK